jgi:hypothetical protein
LTPTRTVTMRLLLSRFPGPFRGLRHGRGLCVSACFVVFAPATLPTSAL